MNSRDKERISFLQMGSMELRSTIQIVNQSLFLSLSLLYLYLSQWAPEIQRL